MGLFDGLSKTTEDTSPVSSGLFAGLSLPSPSPSSSFNPPAPKLTDTMGTMGIAKSSPLFTDLAGPDIKLPFTQKTVPSVGGPVIGAAQKFITELPERLTQDVADIYNQIVHGGTKDTAVFQKGTERVSNSFSEAAGIADEARTNGYSEPAAKALGTIYGVSSLIADFGPVVGAGAKGVLALTKFSPELDGALYRLGLDQGNFSIESWAKQTQNAARNLQVTGDEAGFHQLTRDYKTITEAINGSGDRAATGVLKKVQDVAKSINQPLDEFINGRPQFNTSGTEDILPGYRRAPGQAPAFGMSTERVEPVGFAKDIPSDSEFVTKARNDIVENTDKNTARDAAVSHIDELVHSSVDEGQQVFNSIIDRFGKTEARSIFREGILSDTMTPKEANNLFNTKLERYDQSKLSTEVPTTETTTQNKPQEAYSLSTSGRTRLREGVKWTPDQAREVVRTFFTPAETDFIATHLPIKSGIINEPTGKIQGMAFKGIDRSGQYQNFIKVLAEDGKISDSVVLHEVFEKAVQIAIDDGVFNEVTDNVSKSPLSVFLRDNYPREVYTTKQLRAKETLADDFAEYVRDKSGYKGANKSLWEKLLQYIRKLWRKVTGAQKLYDDLLAGKRSKVTTGDELGNEYGLSVDSEEPKPTDLEPDQSDLARMRSRNLESANKQYLKQTAKEAEAELPRAEIMAVRKQENIIREQYTDQSKVDTALGNVLAQLELSEPGSRTLIGSGTTARMNVTPSTFPKWLPENLRSKKLFEPLIKNVQSLSDLHYPDRINAGRAAQLVDAIYDRIDQTTGVDTSSLRKDITKLYTSPDVRAAETAKIETEKLSQRSAQKTEKLQTEKEKRDEKIKKIQERNAELLQEIAEKQQYKTSLQEKINQAHKDAKNSKGIFAKLKDIMYPVRGLDQTTKAITTDWFEKKMSAHALAQEEFEKAKALGPQNFQEIIDYQAGKNTPYIKEYFDSLGTEFHERGLDFDWRPDYIPQVWKNNGAFKIAINKYLKAKGLSDEEIANYVAGEPLPPEKAIRLKLRPNFVKERFWPDYASGMAHGLTPRYQTPGELIAYYRQQGELAIANREFIDQLKEQGKLLSADDAPDTWEPVNLRFSREGLYAPPELAHLINGQMRNEEKLTFIQGVTKGFAKLSKFMFDARTIAGVPMTTINSFAIGQANKLLVSAIGGIATGDFNAALSDLKASFAVIRANSNKASQKFFAANIGYIVKMAENGISIGENYPGNYQKISKRLVDVFESPAEGIGAIGKVKNTVANAGHGLKYVLDTLFSDKTIASMMGQIQVQTFKDLYIRGLKGGLNETQAAKIAAEITKTFNGMLGEVGRGKTTSDTMGAVFAAPYFREGVLTTLWNGAKAYSTDINNPAFIKSRKFVIGLILAFAAYAALNKKLNDKYMWQNPSGHEFDLRVPLENGAVVYIPFMPSFLAIARNLASGAINLGTGDFDTAKQKLGSVLSTPIELMTELLANKDYYGNQIYNPNDTGKQKTEDLAAYAGLSVTHPYIMETAKYAQGKEPLYQAISKASELPFKFSTLSAEQKNAWYDAQDAKAKERSQAKDKVRPVYDSNQKLKAEGKTDEANAIYNALDPKDKALYDQIKIDEKTKATKARKPVIQGIYDHNQDLLESGRGDEAQAAYLNLSDTDRHVYDLIKQAAQKDQ